MNIIQRKVIRRSIVLFMKKENCQQILILVIYLKISITTVRMHS